MSEWPSSLYSFRQVTEVMLGRVRPNSDVLWKGCRTRGPMPGCGMHSGPKLAFSS